MDFRARVGAASLSAVRFPLRAETLRLGLAILLINVVSAASARADDADDVAALRAGARKLAEEGIALIDAGKKAEGIERLEEAEAKFHAPTHLLYLARAYRDLGKLGAAADDYERLVGEKLPNYAPDAFREAQRLGGLEIAALAPSLAKIRVVLHGAKRDEATVAVDTKAPRPLLDVTLVEPGAHHLTIFIGPLQRGADVTLAGTEERSVDVTFEETVPKKTPGGSSKQKPEKTSSPFLVPGIISFAIGGAGIAAGAATGIVSLNDVAELKKHCPTKIRCSPSDQPLASDARTFGNISTGAFVVGGVGVAAGLLLVLLPAPSSQPSTTRWVRPMLGLGFAGVEGTL